MEFTGRAVNPVCCGVIFRLAGWSGDVRHPRCSERLMRVGLERKHFFGVNVNVKKKEEELFWPKSNPHVGVRGLFQFQVSHVFKSASYSRRSMGGIEVEYPQVLL